MKAKTLSLMLLLSAAPGLAFAGDTIVHCPIANAIADATQSGKLDGTVKFYLAGNQPAGQVAVVEQGTEVNRKTNAFLKGNQKICDWVMQSALIELQDRAKKAGANAVVNIVSNYGNEYRDSQDYECHVGMLMAGVIMKGDLANVQ
jgi:hypothetical protein